MKLQGSACVGFLIFLTCATNGLVNNSSYATVVFRELLEGPLRGNEVLVYDESLPSKIDWSEAYPDDTALIRTTASNFNSTNFPSSILFGSNFAVVWIIENENFAINDVIGYPRARCPVKLILLCLNNNFATRKIFQMKAMVCSKFAAVIKCNERSRTASVFVNFPLNGNSVQHLGIWDLETFRCKEALFPERFKTFFGSVLKVASLCDDFPLLYVMNGKNCTGSNLDALRIISSHLNFSFDFGIQSSDFNWGACENGTWTGLLGDLAYNGRNIVINYFLLNLERYTAFDFTYPYHAEGFGFLAHRPRPLPKWKAVILPFSLNMWMSIGAAIFLVSILFALFSRVFISGGRSAASQPSTALFLMLGALLSQPSGSEGGDRAEWRRVWMATWLLSCIVLVTGYKGNLMAFLTVPQYPIRVETLEQLAQSPLRIVMQDYGEFVPEALRASNDDSLRAIGNKLDLFPYSPDYDIGMDWVMKNQTHVLTETYSYLTSLQKSYNVTQDTYLLEEQLYSGHLSWLLPKHTPYTEVISDTLQRLKETGILQKLFNDHYGDTGVKKNNIVSASSLSLEQLHGAFYLLLLGLTTAFVSCLLEIVNMKLQPRHTAPTLYCDR